MEKIKQKETILTIVLGLLVIYLVKKAKILLWIIFGVGLSGLFSDYLTEKIHWLWMKISHIMGSVMSKVLLSIIFYVFLFPIALLARMSNKNILQLKKSSGSYYAERNHAYKKEDLENIW
jgi:hypothetical protein